MGQKVHPIGIRLGVVKNIANWYADPNNTQNTSSTTSSS